MREAKVAEAAAGLGGGLGAKLMPKSLREAIEREMADGKVGWVRCGGLQVVGCGALLVLRLACWLLKQACCVLWCQGWAKGPACWGRS